jgi:hypothetical protein
MLALFIASLLGQLSCRRYVPWIYFIAPAASAPASKLGDLSSYRAIVVDTLSLVDKGISPARKSRIKDLEVFLGRSRALAEAAFSCRVAYRRQGDRSRAGGAAANNPDASSCKHSLTDLLAIMDGTSAKPQKGRRLINGQSAHKSSRRVESHRGDEYGS